MSPSSPSFIIKQQILSNRIYPLVCPLVFIPIFCALVCSLLLSLLNCSFQWFNEQTSWAGDSVPGTYLVSHFDPLPCCSQLTQSLLSKWWKADMLESFSLSPTEQRPVSLFLHARLPPPPAHLLPVSIILSLFQLHQTTFFSFSLLSLMLAVGLS